MTKPKEQAEVVIAATAMQTTLDEIEALTRRVSKQALGTDAELRRAAELLSKSEQGHRAFLGHLAALAAAVEDLRKRQNESARICGQRAELLDARRAMHDALTERFTAIGAGANEINALMQGEPDGGFDLAAIDEATERLGTLVEAAGALFDEARDAALPELEKQAHAMRQRLGALKRKLEDARSRIA